MPQSARAPLPPVLAAAALILSRTTALPTAAPPLPHPPPQTVDVYFEKKHNWIAEGDKYVDKWRYIDSQMEKKKGFGARHPRSTPPPSGPAPGEGPLRLVIMHDLLRACF